MFPFERENHWFGSSLRNRQLCRSLSPLCLDSTGNIPQVCHPLQLWNMFQVVNLLRDLAVEKSGLPGICNSTLTLVTKAHKVRKFLDHNALYSSLLKPFNGTCVLFHILLDTLPVSLCRIIEVKTVEISEMTFLSFLIYSRQPGITQSIQKSSPTETVIFPRNATIIPQSPL